MGVSYEYYLFVGINLVNDEHPMDYDWVYDTLEDEINGAPGAKLDCIFDGMCGEYLLLGKIMARGDEYNDQEPVQEIKGDVKQTIDNVIMLLDERLPDWRKYGPVKVSFVTHAS